MQKLLFWSVYTNYAGVQYYMSEITFASPLVLADCKGWSFWSELASLLALEVIC